jgi:predicted DNA-binding mobile mystery protein A
VNPHRVVARQQLDRRLVGLAERIPVCPPQGWVKTIRLALGMSAPELAEGLGRSASRILQLERAESDGSIRLSALRRLATALDCRLVYALVPYEPLDHMVRQQARRTVAEEERLRGSSAPPADEDDLDDLLEALAMSRVDTRGLWRLRPGRSQ